MGKNFELENIMPAVADFIADPTAFMKNNVIFPGGVVFTHTSMPGMSGIYNCTLVENTTTHAYKKKVKDANITSYYNLVQANPGDDVLRVYWLRFGDNEAHGMALGSTNGDPAYMFTVRMNSCTLGYAQANTASAAYVSHHNARSDDNDATLMENQNINWNNGVTPNTNMNFAHRDQYIKHYGGTDGSTTFGVRGPNGLWKFYFQKSKGHDANHKNLSIKGLIEIN